MINEKSNQIPGDDIWATGKKLWVRIQYHCSQ